MQKTALIVAGVIFGLLAISHFIRWLYPVEILIDGSALPIFVSVASGVILALLSVYMFIVVKKMKSIINKDKGGN